MGRPSLLVLGGPVPALHATDGPGQTQDYPVAPKQPWLGRSILKFVLFVSILANIANPYAAGRGILPIARFTCNM